MEETDLILWGMGTVRNLRVHWMLKEMKLDYTFHPVHPRELSGCSRANQLVLRAGYLRTNRL